MKPEDIIYHDCEMGMGLNAEIIQQHLDSALNQILGVITELDDWDEASNYFGE